MEESVERMVENKAEISENAAASDARINSDISKLNLFEDICNEFDLPVQDIRTYSPLTLAYIGDGVFDLIIRSIVVANGNTSANKLHNKTSKIVCAETQARLYESIKEDLTPAEKDIYRRGHNAKPHSKAKNASVSDYLIATGFECLIGYLYLTNNMPRLLDLVDVGLKRCGMI